MDELLHHYHLHSNASACTSVSTLNIVHRTHSGGHYQANMPTDLGSTSTPLSHLGIALNTAAP